MVKMYVLLSYYTDAVSFLLLAVVTASLPLSKYTLPAEGQANLRKGMADGNDIHICALNMCTLP